MLLEQLYKQAPPGIPEGFAEKSVQCILTITAEGEHLSFEVLENARAVILPNANRTSNVLPFIGPDNFNYTLGCGQLLKPAGFGVDRHVAWMDALSRVVHPAVTAIARYLSNPDRPLYLPIGAVLTTEQLATLEGISPEGAVADKKDNPTLTTKNGTLVENEKHLRSFLNIIKDARACHPNSDPEVECVAVLPTAPLLIRVQGMGDWWLDKAFLQAHQNHVLGGKKKGAEEQDAVGQCALTYETTKLARLFPASGGKTLVAFNAPAFCSYNRDQCYNAPISDEAAARVSQGLEHLLKTEKCLGVDSHHLLWAHDRSVSNLSQMLVYGQGEGNMALALGLLNGEISLQGKTFTYLCLGEQMKRWVVRDTFEVSGEVLEANLRKWLQCTLRTTKKGEPFLVSLRFMVQSLVDRFLGKKPDAKLLRILMRVALLGERIPPMYAKEIQKYILSDKDHRISPNPVAQALLRLLQHQEGIDTMTKTEADDLLEAAKPSDPKLRRAFTLGRMFNYAERVQMAQANRPNKSLYAREFDRFLNSPRKGYAKIRQILARTGTKMLEQLLVDAGLSLTDSSGMNLPQRFNENEQTYFITGYDLANQARWATTKTPDKNADSSKTTVNDK